MKPLLLITLSAVLCCSSSSGQTNIEKYWGNKGYDAAFSAAATDDGGYIISGLTISGSDKVQGDIIVIKTNAHADTMWTLQLGGPNLEGGNYVMQTTDGGYLVSGHTEDFGARDCDAFMMKLDKQGNRQWLHVYGGDLDDIAEGVVEIPGEGYVFAGITENFGAGPDEKRSTWFVKTNTMGDTVWTRSYGGPRTDYAYSIVHLPQGGFLAAAFSNSWSSNGADNAWLLRLNENGDTAGTTFYHSYGNSRFRQIIPLKDGGYLVAGYTHSTSHDSTQGFAVKLDKDGKELWEKVYGSGKDDIAFYSVAQMSDGNLLFAGVSHKQDPQGNAYTLITDVTGAEISEQHIGAAQSYANAVAVHSNNSYLLAGAATNTDPAGDIYYMAHDVSIAGVPQAHASLPMIYPNPVSNTLKIILPASLANQSTIISIIDVGGRQICTETNDAGKDIQIDCRDISKGIYSYRIISRDGTAFTGKFIVE